jgi:hypothetical protein
MPVLLRHSGELAGLPSDMVWCAVAGTPDGLEPGRRLGGLAVRLEEAFDTIRDTWWGLGRTLSVEPSGELGHAPTCTTYGSDMGLMMAWTRLIEQLAADSAEVVVICDDPWLYRLLAGRPGIQVGVPPPLRKRELMLALRGLASRGLVALRNGLAALRTRQTRANHHPGRGAVLVYGHPVSNAQGRDAYFGMLLTEIPGLLRLMHTDCPAGRALELAADGVTASLHAWGSPLVALTLPLARWRPSAQALRGEWGWLIRRAAVSEGGGGAAAATRWQMHCHRNWLKAMRPRAVCWPWENHPWERDMVKAARAAGSRSLGYQHTVVGRHMYNQSPSANADGVQGLPDLLVCNGPAYRDHLAGWGVPPERLGVGGALRMSGFRRFAHDPAGPVFVALSHDPCISGQMLEAVRRADDGARVFLLKEHPMFPFAFDQSERIRRTNVALPDQEPLAAVLFSTGTVGLEGLLGGLPTLRFMPEGIVAMHILPPGIEPVNVDAGSLATALAALVLPPSVPWDRVLAPAETSYWRGLLDSTG